MSVATLGGLAAIALLVLVAAELQAKPRENFEPPAQHESEGTGQEHSEGDTQHDGAPPPSAGTGDAKPNALDSAASDHEAEGSQQRAEASDKTTWHDFFSDPQVIFNFLIVLFTGYLAIIAKLSLDHSADTAQRQLRAYVCAGDAKIILTNRAAPKVRVVIRNYGQTPAYDLQQQICMFIGPYPPQAPLEPWSDKLRPSKHVLAPSDEVVMSVQRDPPVRSDAVHLLGTQDGTIYIFGEVRYRDAFGADRSTKYRFIYGGLEPIDADRLKFDREGNEAD